MVSKVLDEAQDLVRNRIDLDGDVLGPGQLLGFRMLGNGVAVPHPRGVQQQGVNNVLQKFTSINKNENEQDLNDQSDWFTSLTSKNGKKFKK